MSRGEVSNRESFSGTMSDDGSFRLGPEIVRCRMDGKSTMKVLAMVMARAAI